MLILANADNGSYLFGIPSGFLDLTLIERYMCVSFIATS